MYVINDIVGAYCMWNWEHYLFFLRQRNIPRNFYSKLLKLVMLLTPQLNISQLEHSALLQVELCPFSQNMLKSQSLVPVNVTLFGNRILLEVMKLR